MAITLSPKQFAQLDNGTFEMPKSTWLKMINLATPDQQAAVKAANPELFERFEEGSKINYYSRHAAVDSKPLNVSEYNANLQKNFTPVPYKDMDGNIQYLNSLEPPRKGLYKTVDNVEIEEIETELGKGFQINPPTETFIKQQDTFFGNVGNEGTASFYYVQPDAKMLEALGPIRVPTSMQFSQDGKFSITPQNMYEVSQGEGVIITYQQWAEFNDQLPDDEYYAIAELAPEIHTLVMELAKDADIHPEEKIRLSPEIIKAIEVTVGLNLTPNNLNLDVYQLPENPNIVAINEPEFHQEDIANRFFAGDTQELHEVMAGNTFGSVRLPEFNQALEDLGFMKEGELTSIGEQLMARSPEVKDSWENASGDKARVLVDAKLINAAIVYPQLDAYLKDISHHGSRALDKTYLTPGSDNTLNVASVLSTIPREVQNIEQLMGRLGETSFEKLTSELVAHTHSQGFATIGTVIVDQNIVDLLHTKDVNQPIPEVRMSPEELQIMAAQAAPPIPQAPSDWLDQLDEALAQGTPVDEPPQDLDLENVLAKMDEQWEAMMNAEGELQVPEVDASRHQQLLEQLKPKTTLDPIPKPTTEPNAAAIQPNMSYEEFSKMMQARGFDPNQTITPNDSIRLSPESVKSTYSPEQQAIDYAMKQFDKGTIEPTNTLDFYLDREMNLQPDSPESGDPTNIDTLFNQDEAPEIEEPDHDLDWE